MSGKILSSRFVHRPRYEILQVSDFEFAEQSSLGKARNFKVPVPCSGSSGWVQGESKCSEFISPNARHSDAFRLPIFSI